MAKRKQQDEMAPNGPGIAGIFNEAPLYYLPGTVGDVGAVAIDYPTMRAEPWNQTAAPIPIPSSPQGEILAAPSGADAPQFATGQEWKDLYNLMATETDVYRKYLGDLHQLAGQYFPTVVAANQMDPRLKSEASGWYDLKQKKVFIPLTKGGYEAGEYMDVGPTSINTNPNGVAQYENFIPVITSARNPKMSIRMDLSPIPHEVGHYYDFTGAPADDINQMSWAYYSQPSMTPWDYILRNMSGVLRPEQATGDEQSWFLDGGAPPPGIDVPAEMFADYFKKALQAGVGLDYNRLSGLYGGKPPVKLQRAVGQEFTTPLPPTRDVDLGPPTAYEAAGNEADRLNAAARRTPNAGPDKNWPPVFDAVANLAESLPTPEAQQAMRPELTDQAREFLYWLFTRGYTPR